MARLDCHRGINTEIDWRESVVTEFHVDGYELDAVLPAFEIEAGMSFDGGDILDVEVTQVAEQVWDLRLVTENPTVETNGAGIVEFEDHLLMFEAYGSEANTIALIEAANNFSTWETGDRSCRFPPSFRSFRRLKNRCIVGADDHIQTRK